MKKMALLGIALMIGVITQGQQSNDPTLTPRFTPPSPEASSLGQYGDHPVSYFTGLPDISIPLMEIKSGRINLPIGLSYHASGIKVEQEASRVGLGWSLNAGGVVSRTASGYADDRHNLPNIGLGVAVVNYFNLPSSYNISTYNSEKDVYDAEPDPHFYSFGGRSGKFYFKNRSTYLIEDYEDLKISSPYVTEGSVGDVVIIDEDGIVYTFGAQETTLISGTCTPVNYEYVSSWYLTSIYDPETDREITFTYTSTGNNLESYLSASKNYESSDCFSSNSIGCSNYKYTGQVKILSRIDYSGGYVLFGTESRQDIEFDQRFTYIKHFSNEDEFIDGYEFDMSYSNKSGETDEVYKRLILNGISQYASNELTTQDRYSFNYNNVNLLPARTSKEQDVWGYFNGNGATSFEPTIYQTSNSGRYRFSIFGGTLVNNANDRTADLTKMKYGTLTKITYPTGGYSTFDYSAHEFIYNGISRRGGGLRVDAITNFDSDNTVLRKTVFTYYNGRIPGVIPQVAIPKSSSTVSTLYQNRAHLGSNSGGYVGYDVVDVSLINNSSNKLGVTRYQYHNEPDTEPQPDENDVWDVDCNSDLTRYSHFPFFQWESNEYKRGKPISIEYYDQIPDQGTIPVKEEEFFYSGDENDALKSITVKMGVATQGIGSLGGISISCSRKIESRKYKLTQKIETLYDANGNAHVSDSRYHYNEAAGENLSLASKVEYVEGGRYITSYKYPFDYSSTVASGVYNYMNNKHYISPVVDESVYFNDGTESKLVSSKITHFKRFNVSSGNYRIQPEKVYLIETEEPISSFTRASDPSSPGAIYGSARVIYHSYNSKGLPLSLSFDNSYKELKWFGERLTAEIQLSDNTDFVFPAPPQGWHDVSSSSAVTGEEYYSYYNETVFPVTGGDFVQFWAKNGTVTLNAYRQQQQPITVTAGSDWEYFEVEIPEIQEWSEVSITGTAQLDEVRYIKGNALATTYYYDSRNRLISVAGPGSEVQNYEYDSFGRLLRILDFEGNIIEEYNYNYGN